MMPDDLPARITPEEITALLDQMRGLTSDTPLDELIKYHERKADLLTRVADQLDTPEAHQVAAEAWQQVADLLARHDARQPAE